MRNLLIFTVLLVLPFFAVAMPTAAEISSVESLVKELLPANAKPADLAASAEKLAKEADTDAAKYLLLRRAFNSYVKAGEYEKAEGAFDALLAAIPDLPVDNQDELFSKALFSVGPKSAPNLRARQSTIKSQVKQLSSVKKLKALLAKNPAQKNLYTRLGEAYAVLNDWPSALEAFSHSPDPQLAATATNELSLNKDYSKAKVTLPDFWYDYSSKSDAVTHATRSHAIAIYTALIPTFSGLNKVRVERRVNEFKEKVIAAAESKDPESSYFSVGGVSPAKFLGVKLVGNVKNDKGILSEFGPNSYALIEAEFSPNGAEIDVVVEYTTGDAVGTSGIMGGLGAVNSFTPFYMSSGEAVGYLSSGGTWNIASALPIGVKLHPKTTYRLKCSWNKKEYIWYVWRNKWVVTHKLQAQAAVADGIRLQIGTNRGQNNSFAGTINLNKCYIKIGNQLWWEGVKGAYKNANK